MFIAFSFEIKLTLCIFLSHELQLGLFLFTRNVKNGVEATYYMHFCVFLRIYLLDIFFFPTILTHSPPPHRCGISVELNENLYFTTEISENNCQQNNKKRGW